MSKVKSPGFYTPIDLPPAPYVREYSLVKQDILTLLRRDWGPRCSIKDTEDYPELIGDDKSSRCPACVVYEKFDDFWEYFDYDDSNNT